MQTSWETMNRRLFEMSLLKLTIFALTVLALISGCNSPPYEVAVVKGVVKFDGKPLTEGSVTFSPLASGENKKVGKPAFADLMPDGSFTLSTYSLFDGAVVGIHRASISTGADESYTYDEKGNRVPVVTDVPFGHVSIFNRKFEVKAGEENEFTIELTKEYVAKYGRWDN